jgi:hypothetical protein
VDVLLLKRLFEPMMAELWIALVEPPDLGRHLFVDGIIPSRIHRHAKAGFPMMPAKLVIFAITSTCVLGGGGRCPPSTIREAPPTSRAANIAQP